MSEMHVLKIDGDLCSSRWLTSISGIVSKFATEGDVSDAPRLDSAAQRRPGRSGSRGRGSEDEGRV